MVYYVRIRTIELDDSSIMDLDFRTSHFVSQIMAMRLKPQVCFLKAQCIECKSNSLALRLQVPS